MQDLKHLLKPRKNIFQRHWKPAAVCVVAVLLIVPLLVFAVRKGAQAVTYLQDLHAQTVSRPRPVSMGDELFATASNLLPSATADGELLTATAPDGTELTFTINQPLQQRLMSYLEQTRPPYAAVVALEPATGRVLSLLAYSSQDEGWVPDGLYKVYPMASLFKMVTAAAALESGRIHPGTELQYRGKTASENPAIWDPKPKVRNHSIDVTDAMGKSVNPIYGLIASDLLGKDLLQRTCKNFGFNKTLLLPGVPALPSSAPDVETVNALRIQGCGLDHDLRISPIHAAAITAAFANRGIIMAPRLVDQASRGKKQLKVPQPAEVTRVIAPETADSLTRMLLTTVTSGTSRKAFQTPAGRKLVSEMKIAAKTGTISGDDPKGFYTWFAAYAPADNPQIALVTLVINGEKWQIKATNLGEQALTTFFSQTRTSD